MTTERCRIDVEGVVQGVGFRPFVYRLARERGLHGWVANSPAGVGIEVQGDRRQIRDFLQQLTAARPPQAEIHRISHHTTATEAPTGFTIRHSSAGDMPTASVPVDLAPCADCLRELHDPGDRRYRYPFINCTQCGPRFSIIRQLPYDRANTAMAGFALCAPCRADYEDPANRRFHAEPIACPDCGPQLALLDCRGARQASGEAALETAAAALEAGRIVALKGVGGFQLLTDAAQPAAIARLRRRKQRPRKPLALLVPDLACARRCCELSAPEAALLTCARRPIVLLARRQRALSGPGRDAPAIAAQVAPDNPDLGVMLPASPLHALLMERLRRPLVATSGNLAGEPICIDDAQAIERLGCIADLLLTHDRPIERPLDDAVLRVMRGSPVLLRSGRGYAPLTVTLPSRSGGARRDLLATGGQLKNTIAIGRGNHAVCSQHLGDLESPRSQACFEQAVDDLTRFYQLQPAALLHDAHPGYASTRWAQDSGRARSVPCVAVQHHVAHFFACLAEHAHRGPALGASWDGTGFGDGGVVRGGEIFHWDGRSAVEHVASLRPFPLPGGEQAIREPRRQAAGLLFAMCGEDAFAMAPALWRHFSAAETHTIRRMLLGSINSPLCSSVGRLFDAMAALLDIATHSEFEGDAAMALEFAARESGARWQLPFAIDRAPRQAAAGPARIDWQPAVRAVLQCRARGVAPGDLAAAFHNGLARALRAVTRGFADTPVFLSGGVFQNSYLVDRLHEHFRASDQCLKLHRRIPPNDGGIALGQICYVRALEDGNRVPGNSRTH